MLNVKHKLLARQIKKMLGKNELDNPKIIEFLNVVNDTYQEFDEERTLIELSMEISSRELTESLETLRQQKTALLEAYESLRSTQIQLAETERIAQIRAEMHRAIEEKNVALLASEEEIKQNVKELGLALEVLAEQKQTIESINYKITSSISYAQTIQGAILPTAEYLQTYLQDYFLIYRPKDVVSGDFYWVHHAPNCTIVVVADCTGHGVAGSFMSLIGINLLHSMEQEMENMTPAEMIGKLNVSLEKALKQEERQSFNEGMDIGICKIHCTTDNKVALEFAGAKCRLYYAQQLDKTLQIIEGDRKSVGSGIYPPRIFTHHQLTLAKGDMLYLCSDGLADQNNPQRKKFGENTVRHLLSECHDKPTETQKTNLVDALDAHQQNTEQRDDITFLGIRLC